MFKVDDRSTRISCEVCSKLTIKAPEQTHWRCSGVFIVNFQHISHFVLVFLLFNFKHVIAGLVIKCRGILRETCLQVTY